MGKKDREARKALKAAASSCSLESQASTTPGPNSPTAAKAAPGDDAGAHRTATGVLISREDASSIKIGSFSLSVMGKMLIDECNIELTIGRRYGLVGQNGCGKTNFLQALALREVPIPEHIDIYHLRNEESPTEMSALDTVVNAVRSKLEKLEALEQEIMEEVGPEDERLLDIYEQLDELDPSTFLTRAGELLNGLGFSKEQMDKKTKDMSGGWRMRVALARALFVKPTLLLLDEPTNHLDLEACVWLEEYLRNYPKCLVIVSHSEDFLNGVCTHTIWLTKGKLTYYTGNYNTFRNTVKDNEVVQQKKYEKEQEDIRHLRAFIASCGTYANMVKQANSKQKIIDKMEAEGLTEPVMHEASWEFCFPECEKLPPPVLPFQGVSFSYSGKKEDHLYENLELAIDCDSRIALVGPNGAGKSTLLKLMCGDLSPTAGTISGHSHLQIGRYYQHSVDALIGHMIVLDFFEHMFPNNDKFKRDRQEWRSFLGRYGVSGNLQTEQIDHLSDGQKSRVVIALICMRNPNLLLLDEPTNHLDIEAIDSLAEALSYYDGGLVLVSHDFRLIDQVAKEIWVCDDKTVKPWTADIREYKKHLSQKNKKAAKKYQALMKLEKQK